MPTPSLTLVLEIDWDNDGTYTNESAYILDYHLNRGRKHWLRTDGEGFEYISPGELTITLRNDSGRFTADNPTSPLYPYIKSKRKIKLSVTDNVGSVTYKRFAGSITEIRPVSQYKSMEKVTITALDGLQKLMNKKLSGLILACLNSMHYLVCDYILPAASWTDGWTVDNIDEDVLPYCWVFEKTSALETLRKLAETFLGTIFVGVDGKFNYHSRQSRPVSAVTITGLDIRPGIRTPQPWENIRNEISVTAHPLKWIPTVELWKLSDTPLVEPGQTITIWANYSYNGETLPAKNVATPVATTDYLMNSKADGSGSNLTAYCSIVFTAYGTAAKIEITNTGTMDGYVTLLKFHGDALSMINSSTIRRQDDDSIDEYESQSLAIDTGYLQDVAMATDFVDYLNILLLNPVKLPDLELQGIPATQFLELFTRVTINLPDKNISGDYWIAGLEESWSMRAPNIAITHIWFEPADAVNFWIFTAVAGRDLIFGY